MQTQGVTKLSHTVINLEALFTGVSLNPKLGLVESQGGTPESLKRGPSFYSDCILSRCIAILDLTLFSAFRTP